MMTPAHVRLVGMGTHLTRMASYQCQNTHAMKNTNKNLKKKKYPKNTQACDNVFALYRKYKDMDYILVKITMITRIAN